MNATIQTLPAASANNKPLWAAVGVLGIAVLAMGASLVYTQTRPAVGHTALVAMAPAVTSDLLPAVKGVAAESSPQDEVPTARKPQTTTARPVPAKPRPVTRAPVPATQPAPVVVAATTLPRTIDHGMVASQPVARAMCANCGTIEAVTPVQRKGEAKGVGAVAGGVLGAVVGNQIGNGSGRTAATILGALGGGLAGHTIEKNVKKETVYQVRVQMEDGSSRTIEQATLPAVGSRVVVEGNTLYPADGNRPGPTAERTMPRPQVQTVQQPVLVYNRT